MTKYVGLVVAAGLGAAFIASMDEASLERRLQVSPRPGETCAQADHGRIHQEPGRKGVTLMLARLKYPQAAIEDLDSRAGRGLERSAAMSLALGEWVNGGHAVLITGPTGAGKSWLACALAQHACRRGHSALYQRVARLEEELRMRHANGTFTRIRGPQRLRRAPAAWRLGGLAGAIEINSINEHHHPPCLLVLHVFLGGCCTSDLRPPR